MTLAGLVFLLTGSSTAGAQSTPAVTGTFDLGELDVTFTDPGLATPVVDARIYYPSNGAGSGAPIAPGPWPVIAFGHGFFIGHLDYDNILHALATAGYIVITPDVQNGFTVNHEEFARELAACIDYLMAENLSTVSLFFQEVDSMSGVFGHSMGGGASALVPSVYPDIDAVSGLAAAETNPSAITALGSYSDPYQMISGSSDSTAPEIDHQIPMYEAAIGMKQWISILGGAHCKFTDESTVCDLVSSAGSVTREFQIEITVKYLVPFFDYALKADSNALTFICGDTIDADVAAGHLLNSTTVRCPEVPSDFRRGDVSDDGSVEISDAVNLLQHLFAGGSEPACADAADVDDGGTLGVADVIVLLSYLFVSGPPPSAPGSVSCGSDPTADGLLCVSAACP